ncbi:hypothetical protein GXW82_11580 [Streptacidiphilus sp. 4-A2]|nr:hypothetical protein [Streptacidiphilus sp. 4-A2]
MDIGQDSVAEELRARAGVFVDKHVDLWVAVQDDGTLTLAGQDPVAVFAAAADWLREGPRYTVKDVRWEHRDAEPGNALQLLLCHPADGPEHPAELPKT